MCYDKLDNKLELVRLWQMNLAPKEMRYEYDLVGGNFLKQNILQSITGFIIKYIWILCALLVALELIFVTYTAGILMQQSALGVIQSVAGEVSGRVDGVLRLLTGLSTDERFADTSKPLYDRIIHAIPYQKSYNLYMIALTDKDVNVVSADELVAPTEYYNLAYRDYMQRLYSTGEYQITDAFLSGDNKDTMNYTIAVPILKEGKVEGSVFGSIFFNDIEDTLNRNSQNGGRDFYLLGADNTMMAGDGGEIYGQSFLELSKGSYFWGNNAEAINSDMKEGKSGGVWQLDKEGLIYMTYQQVVPTNWTIIYRVQFMSVFVKLLPVLCLKISLYFCMCVGVHFFGRRYLNRHLAQVNHLLNRMATMQKDVFQSEQPDYDNLLELTQQGLTDQLTGLATRAILFKKMIQFTDVPNAYGAVVFIDLDDLKRINDNFGHEGGDYALIHFAQVLKEYEQRYSGIAARYGGDEFILVFNAVGKKEAAEISQNLCVAFNTTITTKEHSFAIHGSLGVSFYPDHGTRPEDLICKADLALYSAKQKGKNRCAFFTSDNSML